MEIEGRTFLVAGGGSGLGAATTEMLTNEGANAVVADLRGEAADGNIRFVETDVR
jgi:NAD(P)-dependent dehydrogenase (short-subunit alcohol dehydrogenase family)